MLARLFVYKALSCPGSLGECEFTGNFSLGGLHCLGDRVASLRKSVSSYFGLLLRPRTPSPTAFTLPSRQHPFPRAVETISGPPRKSLPVRGIHFRVSCSTQIASAPLLQVHQIGAVLALRVRHVHLGLLAMALAAQELALCQLGLNPLHTPGPDPVIELLSSVHMIKLKLSITAAQSAHAAVNADVLQPSRRDPCPLIFALILLVPVRQTSTFLVDLAGSAPASSTHPLQLPGSVSAATRPCSLRVDETHGEAQRNAFAYPQV